MKKMLAFALMIVVIFGLSACGRPDSSVASALEVSTSASSEQPEAVVVFTNPVLEELVRKAMNKPEGNIELADAQAVTELNLEMQGGVPIPRVADVSDLTQFSNLIALNLNWALADDGIAGESMDISPLSVLTKLERLYICCDDISDISALSGMTCMKDLWIWGNHNISDISALSGMTQMESLWIKGNQISDISVLANMKDLVYLYMEDNLVDDLSPMAGLSKLKFFRLSGNPATDYSPLADIYPNLEEKDF